MSIHDPDAWSAQTIQLWASSKLGKELICTPLPQDCGHRRYYRVTHDEASWVVMEDRHGEEALHRFCQIQSALQAAQVRVPAIYQVDVDNSLLLQEDLGSHPLSDVLKEANGHHYFQKALEQIAPLAKADIPTNNRFGAHEMHREMERFHRWFLQEHAGLQLTPAEDKLWTDVLRQMVAHSEQQPRVMIHRDFHAANLHCLPDGGVGIIDFQDAALGPLTYDWASLLLDARIRWPQSWVEEGLAQCMAASSYGHLGVEQIREWFEWTAFQLHLKILGIFARQAYAYQNVRYLSHLTRLGDYIERFFQKTPSLASAYAFWTDRQPLERHSHHEGDDTSRGTW